MIQKEGGLVTSEEKGGGTREDDWSAAWPSHHGHLGIRKGFLKKPIDSNKKQGNSREDGAVGKQE